MNEVYESINDLLMEIKEALWEILQSGMNTTHPSTLEKIRNLKSRSAAFGMCGLSEKLSKLTDEIKDKNSSKSQKIVIYFDICNYIEKAISKFSNDEAETYYK